MSGEVNPCNRSKQCAPFPNSPPMPQVFPILISEPPRNHTCVSNCFATPRKSTRHRTPSINHQTPSNQNPASNILQALHIPSFSSSSLHRLCHLGHRGSAHPGDTSAQLANDRHYSTVLLQPRLIPRNGDRGPARASSDFVSPEHCYRHHPASPRVSFPTVVALTTTITFYGLDSSCLQQSPRSQSRHWLRHDQNTMLVRGLHIQQLHHRVNRQRTNDIPPQPRPALRW